VAVIELKLQATAVEAVADFASLRLMLDVLHHSLGVFVNVGAVATHAEPVLRFTKTLT